MTDSSTTAPRFPDAATIMAHPRFGSAVDSLADGLAGLYGDDRRLTRRLFEFQYAVTFQIAVCIAAESDDPQSAVVLDVATLAATAATMGIGPARTIRRFVEHMRADGMLTVEPLAEDRRRQRLVPSARMLAIDREWLAAFHAPLLALVPDEPRFAAAVARDVAYHRRYRRVGRAMLPLASRIMVENPAIDPFLRHASGMRLLALLLVAAREDCDSWTSTGFFSLAAERSATSRVHVRNVLRGAEQSGAIEVGTGHDGRVRVTGWLRDGFARWVADALVGVDITSSFALSKEQEPMVVTQ